MSSNRRGGTTGRNKAKTHPGNKAKGGVSSGGTGSIGLPNGQRPRDTRHNWEIPCCQLLEEFTRELWGMEDTGPSTSSIATEHAAEESSTATTTTTTATPTGAKRGSTETPKCFLVQMLRNHFFEQERQRRKLLPEGESTTAAAAAAATNNSNKKKKKKKKKKANKSSMATTGAATATIDEKGEPAETDENDSIAISTTLSQDSQSMSASLSKEEVVDDITASAAITAGKAATDTSSKSHSQAPTASGTVEPESILEESDPSVIPIQTPVDNYLKRFMEAAEHSKSVDETAVAASTTALPPGRDLEAFVRYLNDKYASGSPDDGKRAGDTKKSAKHVTPSSVSGLSVSQEELEVACQSIDCLACQAAVRRALQQEVRSRQPVVLSAMTFGGNGRDTTAGQHASRHTLDNNNNNNNNNNHNGLAIPVLNQKTGQVAPPPPPSTDFDYVALEEGISPMGTLMQVQANLEGVPYFHPQVASITNTTPSASSSNSGSGKKQANANNNNNNNKGGKGEGVPPTRLEWKFVSSSPSSSAMMADADNNSNSNVPLGRNGKQEVFITAQDLEHLAKDLMLPLGLEPDVLVGANMELSKEEQEQVFQKTSKMDSDTRNNILYSRDKELPKNEIVLQEAKSRDDNGDGSNVQIQSPPKYLDLDKSLHHSLEEVAKDIIWDRILYLHPKLNQSVVQTSPSWHSASAFLRDACTTTIMEYLDCMSEYERCLSELANAQGRIPQMFESRAHRDCFGVMISRRLQLINGLLKTAHDASKAREDAWMRPSDNSLQTPVGLSGITLPFCKKWYAEQEFCLQLQKRQKRSAWGGSMPASFQSEGSPAQNTLDTTKTTTLGPEEWVGKIDFHAEDLLTSMLDLTKRVEKGRMDEIREEHNCRCIKVLGVLTKVGQEIFDQLGKDIDNSNYNSGSVRVDDEAIRAECRRLWSQIQQHKNQQARQEFLNEEGGPNMFEQKRMVAEMMEASMRMLRTLRKCVTDKYEPARAPPLMPMYLVGKLAKEPNISQSSKYASLQTVGNSYHNLLEAACHSGGQNICTGGSGQHRFRSIVLALFFQRLSESCSEWHASLAEQELLSAMNSEHLGPESSNISRDSTAIGIAGSSGKALKKSKKKKAKKITMAEKSLAELEVAPSSEQASESSATNIPNGVIRANIASSSVNSFETSEDTTKKGRRESELKDAKDKFADTREGVAGNGDEMSGKSKIDGSGKTLSAVNTKNDYLSTEEVDKTLGVSNKSGSFQTAESYLVGRLTLLLAQDSKHVGRGKTKGSASVVII